MRWWRFCLDLHKEQMLIPPVNISPDVGVLKRQLRSFCAKVAVLPQSPDEAYLAVEKLRCSLVKTDGPATTDDLKLALVKNVLLDLSLQGWTLSLTPEGLQLNERPASVETVADSKERIRNQHLQERNAQLRESSVIEFINSMERNRLTAKGWHSIFSVMRDGDELASSLKRAAEVQEPRLREQRLKEAIDPYIHFVDSQATCPETGLRLNDIWRYFRHTWTTTYKSVPGRSMMILIRDRARPCHPVIGIAALGSSVVQQSVRDRWIGWDKESAIVEFCELATRKKTRRLLHRLDAQINDVYKADLIEEGVLTRWNLKRPTAAVSELLMMASLEAIESHRKYPNTTDLKQTGASRANDWRKLARTSLFKSKRCKHLATLLSIRAEFIRTELENCSLPELRRTMKTPAIRKCVAQLIRLVKADRVGINMMDITVCGAIAPYNPVLGGKLVCTLLCSPEVIHAYRDRYQQQVSVIASSMAGKEIRRNPQLVLLATTSLYGGGSSQYNRLRFPVSELGGETSDVLGFYELGRSEGFGSFHFSKETVRIAQALLGRLESGRKVNSIFGEGVNPLMRKMREALTMVGLPSDILLRHGNKRIIYGVPLAKNFRALLLGLESRPVYYLPLSEAVSKTESLSAFWRHRWLSKRIDNEDVLLQVEHHKLTHPVRHGAKVAL
jgi:hypothetical protein